MAKATKLELPVLFRFIKYDADDPGTVAAIFFTEPGDTSNPYSATLFDMRDGWGSIDPKDAVRRSRPATPKEYGPVKRKLEQSPPQPLKLKVYQRLPSNWAETLRLSHER